MQKIKIKLDFTEMLALSKALIQFDFFRCQTNQHFKIITSILNKLKKKFVISTEQKKYTKKLEYFEAYAIAEFCKIILQNKDLDFFTISIFSEIHKKIDSFL